MREQLFAILQERLADLKELGTETQLREYLEEEIQEFELVGWDKLVDRPKTDDNRYNILSYYLLDKAPKPKQLRHYWVTEDFADVDTDIDPRRREQVKAYLRKRWGEHSCMDVITFGGVHVKSAIQDLGRVFGLNPSEVARVTTTIKMDPNNAENNTLEAIIEKNPTVRRFLQEHPEIADNVRKMQDVKRSIGKHASAFVISNENLLETVPVVRGKGKELVIAYPESSGTKALNDMGYIKFDLLGLEHVGIVADVLNLIRDRHGVEVDWNKIDVDEDQRPYELLRKGYNAGIFQFNTSITERAISIVQPDRFMDLVAINALVRPAALESNAHIYYSYHKQGKYREEEYPLWKRLEGKIDSFTWNLLDMTYGIVTFQEQIMALISAFCGVTFEETNKARKILATPPHKRTKEVEKYILDLQGRWLEKGKQLVGEQDAWRWWDVAVGSLKYAFNLSHSVSYSMLAWRELWLKANYPNEFYEVVTNHLPTDIMVFVEEASDMGITIEPPDVNKSAIHITTVDGKIYLGLSHCKHVGPGPALQIVENAPYESFDDFLARNIYKGSAVNKRVVESLIYVNAFRSFGDRQEIWEKWGAFKKIKEKAEDIDWLAKEYDILGIVLSARNTLTDIPYGALLPSKARNIPEDMEIDVYGVVADITFKTSKSGNPYARLEVTDYKHSVTIFAWQNKLSQVKGIKRGDTLHCRARSMGDSLSLVRLL